MRRAGQEKETPGRSGSPWSNLRGYTDLVRYPSPSSLSTGTRILTLLNGRASSGITGIEALNSIIARVLGTSRRRRTLGVSTSLSLGVG